MVHTSKNDAAVASDDPRPRDRFGRFIQHDPDTFEPVDAPVDEATDDDDSEWDDDEDSQDEVSDQDW